MYAQTDLVQTAILEMTRMSGQHGLSVALVFHFYDVQVALIIVIMTIRGDGAGGQVCIKRKKSAKTTMTAQGSQEITGVMNLDLGP